MDHSKSKNPKYIAAVEALEAEQTRLRNRLLIERGREERRLEKGRRYTCFNLGEQLWFKLTSATPDKDMVALAKMLIRELPAAKRDRVGATIAEQIAGVDVRVIALPAPTPGTTDSRKS